MSRKQEMSRESGVRLSILKRLGWRPWLTVSLALLAGTLLTGCLEGGPSGGLPNVLHVSHRLPARATVGEPFTVEVTVGTDRALIAISIEENAGGLTVVDEGDFRRGEEEGILRQVVIQPTAGSSQTFAYRARCAAPIVYTVTAIARSRDVQAASDTATVECSEG